MLLAAVPVIAGPVTSADVPAEAKWVIHLDAERLIKSGVGQYLLDQARQHGLDSHMATFSAVFGFDPTKDIASITLYGIRFDPASAVVIVRGRFDQEKLVGLLKGNADYQEVSHHKQAIHRWSQNKEDAEDDGLRYGSFREQDTVVISRSQDALKAALDRMDQPGAGPNRSVPAVPDGTFFFAVAHEIRIPEEGGPKAQILRKLSGGLIQAGEAGDTAFLKARLGTRQADDAQRLRRMLDGGLAFLSLAVDHLTEAEGQRPFWAPLVDSATAGGSGDSVELNVTIKTAELIKFAETDRRLREAKKAQETAGSAQ